MIDLHCAGSDQLADPAWTPPARNFPPAGTPDAPDFDNGGAWPWDWSGLSRAQAQRMWDRLEGFVAYLNARYAWDFPHQIPMCWAFHGALVEELTTLYWSRWAAFSGPDANPDKAQTWHTLPPAPVLHTTGVLVRRSATPGQMPSRRSCAGQS